jgi:phage N-6-adenine-methyltransferase
MPKMPKQKPGNSKQDYATPKAFLEAVARRFGPLAFDLAAHKDNVIPGVRGFFDEQQNSLAQNWLRLDGNLWLNPPFGKIAPWAEKCAATRSRRAWTLLLVPASVDADWYHRFCFNVGHVLTVAPRLSFDGKDPFPKGLMLVAYGFGVRGIDHWRWQQ